MKIYPFILLFLILLGCGGESTSNQSSPPDPVVVIKEPVIVEPIVTIPRDTFPLPAGEKLHRDSISKYLKGYLYIPKGVYDFNNGKIVLDTLMEGLDILGDSAIITNSRSITISSPLKTRGLYFDNIVRAWVFKYKGRKLSFDLQDGAFNDFNGAALLFARDTAIIDYVIVKNMQFTNAREFTSTLVFQGHIQKFALIEDNLFQDYHPGFYSTVILGDPIFGTESQNMVARNNTWRNVKTNKINDGARYITLMYGTKLLVEDNYYDGIASAACYLRGGEGIVRRNKVRMENANDDAGVFLFKGQLDLKGWEVYDNEVEGDIKPFIYDESKANLHVYRNYYRGNARKIIDIHASLGVTSNPLFKPKKHKVIIEDNDLATMSSTGIGITIKNTDSLIINSGRYESARFIIGSFLAAVDSNAVTYTYIGKAELITRGQVASFYRSEQIIFNGPSITFPDNIRYPLDFIDCDTLSILDEIILPTNPKGVRKLINVR